MSQLDNLYKEFVILIQGHRFSAAIDHLVSIAHLVKAPWQSMREIDSLKERLGFITDYALRAADDPTRSMQISQLESDARTIAQSLIRYSLIETSPRQYFAAIRYENLQPATSISQLIDQYSADYSRLSMACLVNQGDVKGSDGTPLRQSLEALAERIFNRVWTRYPLDNEDSTAIAQALLSDKLPEYFRELLIGALLLGYINYPDEQRIVLLAQSYMSATTRQSLKSLTAMALALITTPNYAPSQRANSVLAALVESPHYLRDLHSIAMSLARTRDTQRLSRTLNEEIIPQFMKMSPGIDKNSIINIEDPEENPEWMEMLEKSGVTDKLRALTEETAQGSDVMLGSFSHLKSFPFFHNLVNWFLPFYTSHSSVSKILGDETSALSTLLEGADMMCDGDKYSLVFSFDNIPSSGRRMMMDKFDEQMTSMAEMASSELNADLLARDHIINRYVQDLYRFFHLYRRKGEYPNPFAMNLNIGLIRLFAPLLNDSFTIRPLAEYYFSRKYYAEALPLFEILTNLDDATPLDLQRAGFCEQRVGNWNEAIEFYIKSDIVLPDNVWTLRRLAQCFKSMGDNTSAYNMYKRILKLCDDDISLLTDAANCMLDQGDVPDALKLYYKVRFLDPDSHKTDRSMAWALFLAGQYDKALPIYDMVIAGNPNVDDYINMGHLFMAMKQYDKALIYYGKAREKMNDTSINGFFDKLYGDIQYLKKAGVDSDIIDLVFDRVSS